MGDHDDAELYCTVPVELPVACVQQTPSEQSAMPSGSLPLPVECTAGVLVDLS